MTLAMFWWIVAGLLIAAELVTGTFYLLMKAKFPMASIDGVLVTEDPDTSGVEVRFNPKRTHLFVDQSGFAVRWAENVTVVGHRAFARGVIVYHSRETAPPLGADAAATEAKIRMGCPGSERRAGMQMSRACLASVSERCGSICSTWTARIGDSDSTFDE